MHCYPLSAWQRALDLLAAHPYVIEPTSMAYMRGVALEHLGRYRSAARCHAVALRNPQLAPGVLSSATVPDRLISAGRWEDAEGYMRALVDAVPHPFVLASASFVFYRCIRRPGVTREARGAYVQAQIDAMVRAGAAVVETPSQVGDRNAFGQFLAVVLVAAAETFLNVGRPDDAWRLLADAHTLDPAFAAKAEVELRRQVAERARRAAERNTAADQDDEVKLPDWAIANRADPMDRRRAHTTETTWQNLGTAA